MESFCKKEECPTSDELAALIDREARSYADDLERHLSVCEFCSAEVDLYRHHPPVVEEVVDVEMPRPLFELAEAILHDGKTDLSPLYRLIDRGD